MKKFGLVVDSTVGLTKKEVEEKGGFFVPLLISINGEEFKTGIDIDNKKLFELMVKGKKNINIKTSTPITKDIFDALEKSLNEYEKVV